MRLTTFSDYSIRVMMYLGTKRGELVKISDIANAYRISENHLTKVVHYLAQRSYIETVRGKGGGLRLIREPKTINIGELIVGTEGDAGFLPCLDSDGECCIQSACKLMGILREAQNALYAVLNKYTLADLLTSEKALANIFLKSENIISFSNQ